MIGQKKYKYASQTETVGLCVLPSLTVPVWLDFVKQAKHTLTISNGLNEIKTDSQSAPQSDRDG